MILVTGGAGYIGSHTCIELLEAGHELLVLDNFSNSRSEALQRVYEITGADFDICPVDLRNKQKLKRVFSENRIDAVLHFAGYKSVNASISNPLAYYKTNVVGTLNLCDVMQQYGVNKLVFSSSAAVYGNTENVPISEADELSPVNPYGRSKQMVEDMLRDIYVANPTWNIAILRYFNPGGAHPSGYLGENPRGTPTNLLPYIAQVATGQQSRLNIYGNDYPTPDGTGVRDYIHVTDLALGHLRALESLAGSQVGINTYNLGTGEGYSVLEVVKAFEHATGIRIPYIMTDRREGDAVVSYADPTKANQELNWRATKGIEAMCQDLWRFQNDNPNGYSQGALEKSIR